MNLTKEIPVHRRLWLVLSIAVYALLGFFDFVPALNKGDGMRYWEWWLLAWEWKGPCLADSIGYLFAFTIILLIPSIILGFALQCFVVLTWEFSGHGAKADDAVSQQEKGNGNP